MFQTPQKRTLSHCSTQHGASSDFLKLSATYDKIRMENSPCHSVAKKVIKIQTPVQQTKRSVSPKHPIPFRESRTPQATYQKASRDLVCNGCFNQRLQHNKQSTSQLKRQREQEEEKRSLNMTMKKEQMMNEYETSKRTAEKKFHQNYYRQMLEEKEIKLKMKADERDKSNLRQRNELAAQQRHYEEEKNRKKQQMRQHSAALLEQIHQRKPSDQSSSPPDPSYWRFIESQQEQRSRWVQSQKQEVLKSYQTQQEYKQRQLEADLKKKKSDQKIMDATVKKQNSFFQREKQIKQEVQKNLQNELASQIALKQKTNQQRKLQEQQSTQQLNEAMNYQEWLKRQNESKQKEKSKQQLQKSLKTQIDSKVKNQIVQQEHQKKQQQNQEIERDRKNELYQTMKHPQIQTEPCGDCNKDFPINKLAFFI